MSNDSPQRETKRNFLLWICFSFNWKVLFNYNIESSGESDDCNGNNLLDQLDQTDQ
mgnify:FL=1